MILVMFEFGTSRPPYKREYAKFESSGPHKKIQTRKSCNNVKTKSNKYRGQLENEIIPVENTLKGPLLFIFKILL